MSREAFGPNLRRLRIQRGVSLAEIARTTKVSERLWAALERSDCSRWPTGIYARAYVRDYARLIGVDPEATVDEFCRLFPQGDRRVEVLIRGQAEIVGHEGLEWVDPVPPTVDSDRRASRAASTPAAPVSRWTGAFAVFDQMFTRLRRAVLFPLDTRR